MTTKEIEKRMMTEMELEQTVQIRLGEDHGINTSIYDDRKKFDPDQMREIRLGLEKGIHILDFVESWRYHGAMKEVRLGLESGVDVSLYSNPDFISSYMKEIRLLLENNLFKDEYLKIVDENDFQMLMEIRTALMLNIDIDVWRYKGKKIDDDYREEIRSKIRDILVYA